MNSYPATTATLKWLAVWPWLNQQQLAILLDQNPDTVRRRLHDAQQVGWVQKLSQGRPDLPTGTLYALTDAGLAFLAERCDLGARRLARRCNLAPATLYQVLNCQDQVYEVRAFVLSLLMAAQRRGDQVVEGRTFVRRRFKRGRTWRTFRADAYVVYQREDQYHPFFLLVDRGTLPLENLRDAVAAYLHYRESGCYQGAYSHFPDLVTVMANEERLTELRFRGRALGHRLRRPPPRLALTLRHELWTQGQDPDWGPLAPIWRAGDSYDEYSRIPLLRAVGSMPAAQVMAVPDEDLAESQDADTRAQRSTHPARVLGPPLAERIHTVDWPAVRAAAEQARPRPTCLEEGAALLNASLSPAVQAVLDLVSRIGYLTPDQLAVVQQVSVNCVQRYLRALETCGAVATWSPPDGDEPRYYPTRLAVYRLARQRGFTLRQATRQVREYRPPGNDAWNRQWPHTRCVREFFIYCYEDARERGGDLLGWQSEWECERRFRHDGRIQYLRPDGYGQLCLEGMVWPFYLEWDHGNKHWQRKHRRHFGLYYAYRATQSLYAIEGHFPTILVVTLSPTEVQQIRRAVREGASGQQSYLPVRVTTEEYLHRYGLFGAIWWSALEDSPRTTPFQGLDSA